MTAPGSSTGDAVVPPYEDDDIVEEYEEIDADESGEIPVREVLSAQGGPVARPTRSVRGLKAREGSRRETAGPNGARIEVPTKGKITHKQAKMIWAVCIAISVLGIGMFVADYAFNLFGRHAEGDTAGTPEPTPKNKPKERNEPRKSAKEIAADEFTAAVKAQQAQMRKTRAYDFMMIAYHDMLEKRDLAIKVKGDEGSTSEQVTAAWVDAINAYLHADYAVQLFLWKYGAQWFEEGVDLNDRAAVEYLWEGGLLEDEENRTKQAAYSSASFYEREINKFHSDVLRYDLSAQKVWGSDDPAIKDLLKAASDKKDGSYDGKFLPEDIEYVNQPDRDPAVEPDPWK